MREQHLLHLGRRDVLAADAEDVLQRGPTMRSRPSAVEHAEVAGAQPAVGA